MSVHVIGPININFQEIGLILMIGGAASLALWIALAADPTAAAVKRWAAPDAREPGSRRRAAT